MAVLGDETVFMTRVRERIGDDTSDTAIAFMEDMQDTYRHLSSSAGTDWEAKFKENDAEWRKRYTERFYSGSADGTGDAPGGEAHKDVEPPETPAKLRFSDLFKED